MTHRSRCTPFRSWTRLRAARLTQALSALLWLGLASPALADAAAGDPPATQSSAPDAPSPSEPTKWGPIVAACLGVLAGGWIARKQIRGWKRG